jgi:hypothetical protein
LFGALSFSPVAKREWREGRCTSLSDASAAVRNSAHGWLTGGRRTLEANLGSRRLLRTSQAVTEAVSPIQGAVAPLAKLSQEGRCCPASAAAGHPLASPLHEGWATAQTNQPAPLSAPQRMTAGPSLNAN